MEPGPQHTVSAAVAPTADADRPIILTAYRLKPDPPAIIPSPADRLWMDSHRNGANRCLPLRMANQAGWVILNDCDFDVTWRGGEATHSLKIWFAEGQRSRYVKNIFGFGILTWFIPYLFRTPPGYNLLARGPANWFKDGAFPLEGLVETDWSTATFTMNWKLTRPFWKVRFRKGDPICMILPQRRGEIESVQPEIRNIESQPELERAHDAFAESRTTFIAKKQEILKERSHGLREDGNAPWQPDYTLGKLPGGVVAREHQVKLDLRPFVECEPPAPERPAEKSDVASPDSTQGSDRPSRSVWHRAQRLWAKAMGRR